MAEIQTQPLSITEARKVRDEYRHLEGKSLQTKKPGMETIEQLVLAPHDSFNQWFFFNYFMEKRDNREALEFYAYPFYDVLAIIRCTTIDGEVTYMYRPIETVKGTVA